MLIKPHLDATQKAYESIFVTALALSFGKNGQNVPKCTQKYTEHFYRVKIWNENVKMRFKGFSSHY